jgi:predicted MPP superfamily phosphohydrolase
MLALILTAGLSSRSMLPDGLALLAGVAINAAVIGELRSHPRFRERARTFSRLILAVLTFWLVFSLDFGLPEALRVYGWLPGAVWIRAAGLGWVLLATAALPAIRAYTRPEVMNPARRRFLQTVGMAGLGAPVAAASAGFIYARSNPVAKEENIRIPGLHKDLEGLRIVQVSDIHLSPFVSRSQLARAVDMANEARADVAVVTGDLITSSGDPLDDCLQELHRLRALAGVYGCLGNHEIMAGAEEYATKRGAKLGIRFLRQESAELRFGSARLNLAGVDYQKKGTRYLSGATRLLGSDSLNILLCHNPDVFPVAAAQGWNLTIAGHTHGGQITLEYLHPLLNPALFYTPFVYGLYQRDGRSMYVTSGIGTVGMPIRIGIAPEISLLKLTRAE